MPDYQEDFEEYQDDFEDESEIPVQKEIKKPQPVTIIPASPQKSVAPKLESYSKGKPSVIRGKALKRATELGKSFVDLDFTPTFLILDMQPLTEYEMYIYSFGSSNAIQIGVQTGEELSQQAIQTEPIEVENVACMVDFGNQNQISSKEKKSKKGTDAIVDLDFLKHSTEVYSILKFHSFLSGNFEINTRN